MKIISLNATESLYYQKTFSFTSSTLITSFQQNSQGKTTLLRWLLYSLGFNIPSLVGFSFEDFSFVTVLEVLDKTITLKRSKFYIDYTDESANYTFDLRYEMPKLHSLIFHTSNPMLLDNLLGVFYVDQTKGSVVLNRGDVIGGNSFLIDNFVAGLSNTDINDLNEQIIRLKNERDDYESIGRIKQIDGPESSELGGNNEYNEENYDDEQQVTQLETEIRQVKLELKDKEAALRSNNEFFSLIESYNIYVVDKDNTPIPVTAKTMYGVSDITSLLRNEMNFLDLKLRQLKRELAKHKKQIKESLLGTDIETIKSRTIALASKLGVSKTDIDSIVELYTEQMESVRKQIKDIISGSGEILNYMNESLRHVAKTLDVGDLLDEKGVLANKMQNKSGVRLYELIIAFRITYIKAFKKVTGISLPLIIDSFRHNELSLENTDKLLNVIHNELEGHQIIVTSIYNINFPFTSRIDIQGRLI